MKVLMMVVVLCLVGCAAGPDTRRVEAVTAHPEWPERDKANVLAGKIQTGMTKEQVEASWGPPCWCCYGTRRTSHGEWWQYSVFGCTRGGHSGTRLYFNNAGILEYWAD